MQEAGPSNLPLNLTYFHCSLKVNMQVLMRHSQRPNLVGKEKLLNF